MTGHAAPGRRTRRQAGRRLRSLGAGGALVARRRARRDVWLLLASTTLIALSTLLAAAGPRVVLETVDGGARDAVTAAGASGDLVLSTSVGDGAVLSTPVLRVARTEVFLELAEVMPDRLPPALTQVHADRVVTVLSPDLALSARDGVADRFDDTDGQVELRAGLLTGPALEATDVVTGRLPEPRPVGRSSAPVEVVLSAGSAEAAAIEVGTTLRVGLPAPGNPGPPPPGGDPAGLDLLVVGLVEPQDPAAAVWGGLTEAWAPVHTPARDDGPAYTRITALTTPDGVTAVSGSTRAFTGSVRLTNDPAAFTTALAAQVEDEVAALRTSTTALDGDSDLPFTLTTSLDTALAAYPPQARAALAQMSVMIAGVVGVAAVVVVLLSRLLIGRRRGVLALERARGASVAAVALRLGTEALVVAGVGTGAGLLAAWLLVPGPVRDPLPVAVVAGVGLLASPVQGAWLARRAWTGTREPANRADRARLRKRRGLRRVVADLAVVVLAGAAALSLRDRGLLQTQTDGIDPFLAVAPVLLALAVTVVLLRVYPWPVRAAGVLGRRTRGVLGLLGAVRAQGAVTALPLLALTLGMALAVAGGLLVGTVRGGQVDASWERIGADVRIDGEVPLEEVADLAAAPGVTAAGGAKVSEGVAVDLGTRDAQVTVLAVDRGYPATAAAVAQAQGVGDGAVADDLAVLADPVADGDRLPVVVDAALADLLGEATEINAYLGPSYLELEVVGTTSYAPSGYLEGPFLFLDLTQLAPRTPAPQVPTTVWAVGPGADDAAATLAVPQGAVQSRTQWLDVRRDLALLAGVEQMMVLSVAAVALLAVVALVATVLAGARDRGRALSMLRTLGMHPRLGWWLALSELAPVVLAALVGGAASGVAIVLLLAPALGLDVLAGGLSIPDPQISPAVIGALAVGVLVLLVLAVLAEVLAHRRDRLNDVLRVGETV